ERLRPRGNTRGRPARDQPEKAQRQNTQDARGDNGVVMNGPETARLRRWIGKEREVVLDVGRRVEFVFRCHRWFLCLDQSRIRIAACATNTVITKAAMNAPGTMSG